jgi:hypothetical protein
MSAIASFGHDGEGLKRVYENAAWMVGVKNYKPANDAAKFDEIELHRETDELFILLDGACILLEGFEEKGGLRFGVQRMTRGLVYVIPASRWHTTITEPGAKLALIEDPKTGSANSDV